MSLFKRAATYADLVDKTPQLVEKPSLLKGEWNLCAHKTGFWYGSASEVSDQTGNYLRLTGDCKSCCKPVFVIRDCVNEPS